MTTRQGWKIAHLEHVQEKNLTWKKTWGRLSSKCACEIRIEPHNVDLTQETCAKYHDARMTWQAQDLKSRNVSQINNSDFKSSRLLELLSIRICHAVKDKNAIENNEYQAVDRTETKWQNTFDFGSLDTSNLPQNGHVPRLHHPDTLQIPSKYTIFLIQKSSFIQNLYSFRSSEPPDHSKLLGYQHVEIGEFTH